MEIFLYPVIGLYLSIAVSYALYAVSLSNLCATVAKVSKSSKSRKDFAALEQKASLYLKLSPIWPVILCLIIIEKIRG